MLARDIEKVTLLSDSELSDSELSDSDCFLSAHSDFDSDS